MARQVFRRGEKPYVFRAAWRRGLAGALDAVGRQVVRLLTLGRGLTPDPAVLANPKKILVIRLDHVGDILFTRPCLEALHARFPQAVITVLAARAGRELFAHDPNIGKVLVWEAPWFARTAAPAGQLTFWQLARQLRKKQFDLSVDLRGDFRHHVLAFLAGVRVRAGYGITGGGFLLHITRPLPVGRHEVERNLALAQALGAAEAPEKYTPLSLAPDEIKFGQTLWQTQGRRVVVHPAAGDPSKRWPLNRLVEICDALSRMGCELVLVGTPSEHFAAQALANACAHPPRVLAGQTSLRQLAAVLASAHAMVGSDSGPAHLAVTQGVPTVMLWSQTNEPSEWGPWGRGVQAVVVRQPERESAAAEVAAAVKHFLAPVYFKKSGWGQPA